MRLRPYNRKPFGGVDRVVATLITAVVAGLAVDERGAAALPLPAVSGFLRYESFGYPDQDSASPNWENFFELVARLNGRVGEHVSYRFEGRAVADDVEFTVGAYHPRNAGTHRAYLSVITGAVDIRPADSVRVGIGKQIVNWSTFDAVQPANLITPYDESDLFRRIEVGVPSVTLHVEHEPFYADVAIVPLALTPSRVPQGRWNIVPPGQADVIQDMPPVRMDETQGAVRLGAQVGGLDVSLIAHGGRDYAPVFVPELVYVGGPERFALHILERYPRTWEGGSTGSYLLGESLLLRGEVVYFATEENYQDNFFLSGIGVEYTRGDWRLNLNYLRNDRVSAATEEPTDKGERQFFQSFVFGELRYDAGGKWSVSIPAGYDLDKDFGILNPELVLQVWRTVELALTGDIIRGHGDTYFARIRHEDRVGTRVTYYF